MHALLCNWQAIYLLRVNRKIVETNTGKVTCVLPAGMRTDNHLMQNALEHPGDPKYRRIKFQNPAFYQRAGRLPGSVDLLKSAGFVMRGEDGEQILNLEREDPGLLWLTLSACEQALQRISVA